MGQVDDILDAPLFAPLRKRLETQINANRSPVSLSRQVFHLPDSGLLGIPRADQ